MGPLFIVTFLIIGITLASSNLVGSLVDSYGLYIAISVTLLSIFILPLIVLKFKTVKNRLIFMFLWTLLPLFLILILERNL